VSVSGLQHVLVLSDDLEATREFYSAALGLTVGERPPLPFPGYWLYAEGEPCLHIGERGPYLAHARTLGLGEPGAGAAGAVDHLAFSATGLEEVSARLAAAGIEPVANEIPAAGIRQLFFEDPNGVRLELNVQHVAARAA
jgi:catechol 2,3-dioxygenase-like lactoylglutathione lyase family enzyme